MVTGELQDFKIYGNRVVILGLIAYYSFILIFGWILAISTLNVLILLGIIAFTYFVIKKTNGVWAISSCEIITYSFVGIKRYPLTSIQEVSFVIEEKGFDNINGKEFAFSWIIIDEIAEVLNNIPNKRIIRSRSFEKIGIHRKLIEGEKIYYVK